MTQRLLPSTRKATTSTGARLTSTYTAPDLAIAIDAIEAAIGGRAALVSTLVQADPRGEAATESLTYVMGMIADPANREVKLSELCARGKITLGELLGAYKAGAIAQMQIDLINIARTQVPAVVADLFARAQIYDATCASCAGTASVPGPKPDDSPTPCTACGATGIVKVFPELERQKLALDIAGLMPKKAPLIEQKTMHLHGGGGIDFGKLLAATDQVLHRRSPADVDEADTSEVIDADIDSASPPE